jgi:hypothetical protein
MNKTAITAITIFMFTISFAAGIQTLEVANAYYAPPPSIEILSPIPTPDVHSNASVMLNVRVNVFSNESDITFIRYSLDGKANVTLANLTKEDNVWYWTTTEGVFAQGKAFSTEASLGNLTDGNHTLTVYAPYADGKEMSKSREFTVDTHYKYPEIVVLSPQNTTYASNEVPLTWTCDEQILSANYFLDEPLYGATPMSGNTTLTGLSNDTHTITVFVLTERGQANSQTVHFTVAQETESQPTPFSTLLVVAVTLAVVAVVAVSLLVYFKKRDRSRIL